MINAWEERLKACVQQRYWNGPGKGTDWYVECRQADLSTALAVIDVLAEALMDISEKLTFAREHGLTGPDMTRLQRCAAIALSTRQKDPD